MPLGIDPKVDFAFQKMLGSPEHSNVTVHFLNSVLQFPDPIVEVEILNPIQGRQFPEDKVVILDVLARDNHGRRLNIEMQSTLPAALPQRLTLYNCLNYVRQITQGQSYEELRPAISICVLDRVLFPQAPQYHLSFRLRCDQAALILTDDLEFHLLELPKFHASCHNIGELHCLDRWAYLLKHAEAMEAEELSQMLVDDAYREAIGVLSMISKSPEDRLFYESRLKYLRDEEARLLAARREGRQEGLEEGILAGRIQLLQELLGEPPIPTVELVSKSPIELSALMNDLQARLQSREN